MLRRDVPGKSGKVGEKEKERKKGATNENKDPVEIKQVLPGPSGLQNHPSGKVLEENRSRSVGEEQGQVPPKEEMSDEKNAQDQACAAIHEYAQVDKMMSEIPPKLRRIDVNEDIEPKNEEVRENLGADLQQDTSGLYLDKELSETEMDQLPATLRVTLDLDMDNENFKMKKIENLSEYAQELIDRFDLMLFGDPAQAAEPCSSEQNASNDALPPDTTSNTSIRSVDDAAAKESSVQPNATPINSEEKDKKVKAKPRTSRSVQRRAPTRARSVAQAPRIAPRPPRAIAPRPASVAGTPDPALATGPTPEKKQKKAPRNAKGKGKGKKSNNSKNKR